MVGLLFLRGSRGTTAFSLFVEVGSTADAERPLLVRLASVNAVLYASNIKTNVEDSTGHVRAGFC